MNKWIKRIVALSFITAQFLVIPNVSASSLEEIQNQKQSVEQEVTQLQGKVNAGLEEVSELSNALNDLNNEIESHKQTISDTEKDIEEQEIVVAQRYEYISGQLQAMQTNEVNNNIVLSIIQAESFSDLINNIYSASILTSASEDRLVEAQVEHEKLNEMRATLLAEKETLDTKQIEVVQQKEKLDIKVAELQKVLAANEAELNQLNAQEDAIKKAIAEKAAAQKRAAEEKAAAQKAKAPVSTASNNTKAAPAATSQPATSNKSSAVNNTQASQSSSSAGEWKTMQATGYSTQQPGLSTHTASGIDLRVNPRVIAVDPRVIPLGSLVEIQGLGVYVAGDTGGAIKGNIIDIHYPTVKQALNWGRRSVKIRIIN